MIGRFASIFTVAAFGLAPPALAQSLPNDVLGSWDVSAKECRISGTSMTQIDITRGMIDTYGGDAIVKDVERSGSVIFVAADYLQLEGAMEVGERKRNYFRLTQREGPDRLNFKWKGVQTVDLVRCDVTSTHSEPIAEPATDKQLDQNDDRVLPLPTGLWVIAGDDCLNPANASWRIYDGHGIYGASSSSCTIDAVSAEDRRYVIDQTCIATYSGNKTVHRDIVIKQAPKRFGLLEDGETVTQDFNWCSPRLKP